MSLKLKHFFITIFIPFCLSAQDSTRAVIPVKPATKYFTEKDVDRSLSFHHLDTNSNRLEVFNPVQKNSIAFQDLGNLGLASRSLVFDAEKNPGFQYGFNPYQAYALDPEKTEYINTRTPYSDATFAQGGKEMLFLRFKHAQNILPRWNMGVDVLRATSQGFLLRQYSSVYGINAFTAFSGKNKRYILLANITWNFGLTEENGGITSDSSFESLTGKQKQVYTNLAASETHFHNRHVYLRQYYRFGKSNTIYSDKDTVYDFVPQSQIVYTFHGEEMSYGFYNNGDTSGLLLPHQYYDIGSTTYDSAYAGKLSNKLEYQILNGYRNSSFLGTQKDSVRLHFSAGLTHEMVNAAQIAFVRQYQDVVASASFNATSLNDLAQKGHVGLSYVFGGYNNGDYKADASIRLKYNRISFIVGLLTQRFHPDYYYQLFKSNQFIWNNQFSPVQNYSGTLGIASNRWRNNIVLTARIQHLQNWVYMNESSTPSQFAKDIQVMSLQLNKTIQIGKMRFEHTLLYQKCSNNIIRLPEFSAFIRYYYQARLFGISRLQIGVNAFYNSSYYGNFYNPANREFFLQNTTLIGNYPVINPFLVADIKRASIFVLFEHANMDWVKTDPYYTAHYPIALNAFRLGVRWRFYD